MKLLRDTWLVFQRHMLLMRRSPLWVVLGVAQPVVYLSLFAPLLKPALRPMGAASMTDAYRIYVPGMLVALALGGGLYVGFGLLGDLANGVIERARVTTVSRVALLLGRSLRDVVTVIVQSIIITVLSLPFGVFVNIGSLLLGYAILALVATVGGVDLLRHRDPGGQPQRARPGRQQHRPAADAAVRHPAAAGARAAVAAPVADFNPFNWAAKGLRALFIGHTGRPGHLAEHRHRRRRSWWSP